MGGSGSGRWGYHTRRRCVGEGTFTLPAATLAASARWCAAAAMNGSTTHSSVAKGRWSNGGEFTATVESSQATNYRAGAAVLVQLESHTGWHAPHPARLVRELELVARSQPRGGQAWLWNCPNCRRHVRALYVVPYWPAWCCRRCGSLRYSTQRMSNLDRASHRARVVAQRAGASWPDVDDFPQKRPKGMHRRTFARLHAQWEAASCEWEDAITAGTLRFLSRMQARR